MTVNYDIIIGTILNAKMTVFQNCFWPYVPGYFIASKIEDFSDFKIQLRSERQDSHFTSVESRHKVARGKG